MPTAGLLLISAALFAAPEIEVQGLYEGTCKGASGEVKMEARVVALGKGAYKIYVRQDLGAGKAGKVELDGKTEGDAVSFKGKAGDAEWTASYAGGSIRGACGPACALALQRVERKSPTLGKKPPAGAVVLLDGKTFDEVTKAKGKGGSEPDWNPAEDGSIEVPKGGMNSKRTFDGGIDLHVEFLNPFMPAARGQGRGNSGVYLPNGDEIQVLDSFGMDTYTGGGCGGIYKYKDPDAFDVFSLASLPPGQWQTYDVEYRVEKKDGKPAGKPRVTVFHNGIKIHDQFELKGGARAKPLHFQDHGNPVRYRNIWVMPVDAAPGSPGQR